MRSVSGKQLLWIFLAGCTAPLAFAPYYLLWILPMSISIMMLYVADADSGKEAFVIGWLFGCGYFLSGLYWISYPLLFYFLDTFWWLAPVAILVVPCLLGLYPALCCLVMHRLTHLSSIQFAVCFACVWVFFEFLRTNLFTGFPWLVSGYSLMRWPFMIQSASTFGLFGLSFIVMCFSVVPFILIVSRKKFKKTLACCLLVGLFVANALYGLCVLHRHGTTLLEYKVKIIQPNLDGLVTRDTMDENARSIISLAKLDNAKSDKLLYVLLPEGALSSFTSKTFAELIKTSVPEYGYLISGGDRKEYRDGKLRVWNSMFVFDRRGHVIDMYDKTHLVPFGEYMPLRSLLPDSLHAVVAYAGVFPDFSAGTGPRVINIADKFSFSPMICYESLFSHSVRDTVPKAFRGTNSASSRTRGNDEIGESLLKGKGHGLLINFTTDMWYKNSTGPYQHFDMSRLRAVEYGVPFIRVASTGISGVVDPYGRVLAQLPLGERGALLQNIPVRRSDKTLYARLGDSLALSIIGFIFMTAIYFGWPRRGRLFTQWWAVLCLVGLLGAPGTSLARWAAPRSASTSYEMYTMHVRVNADAGSEMIVESKRTILNESARAGVASQVLEYNGDNEKLEIIEAKTFTAGKEYILQQASIEDKPLASAPSGFDQKRQVLLSFPNAQVGSQVYLKLKLVTAKPEVDGVFSRLQSLEQGSLYKQASITLESVLPMNILINDPRKVFTLKRSRDQGIDKFVIKLHAPLYEEIVDEPENSVLNTKHLTWISFSSVKDWRVLADKLGLEYGKVIDEKLPEPFNKIMLEAREEKNEVDKINKVTNFLIDRIRYMGNWVSVKGRYYPRSLAKVDATREGDCKDFTASAGAILKRLNLKVQAAFVRRGDRALSIEGTLPTIEVFNHAILKVTDKAGRIYWIDPTNRASMAGGVFPDIAGRIVLVSGADGGCEMISNINPMHSSTEMKTELSVHNEDISYSGSLAWKGESASSLAGLSLYLPDSVIKDSMFKALSDTHLEDSDKLAMVLPNLSSRTVHDLSMSFAFNKRDAITRTNLGEVFRPYKPGESVRYTTSAAPGQISDLYLGEPHTHVSDVVVKNMKLHNIATLNFELDSPWISVRRHCWHQKEDTRILDTVVLKTRFIEAEALAGQKYKKLKRTLTRGFQRVMLASFK